MFFIFCSVSLVYIDFYTLSNLLRLLTGSAILLSFYAQGSFLPESFTLIVYELSLKSHL